MARLKDENKRALILEASKTLFSKQGFFNTSISDIVKATNLPVGSIYTYFPSKDEIMKVIVEEGWKDLYDRLLQTVSSQESDESKLKAIIEKFLPEILKDVDLINILLSEAIAFTKIEEKIEVLSTMIYELIRSISKSKPTINGFNKRFIETALMVFFLGILNAVRLSRASSIDIKEADIIKFLKISIENSMDIKI
ncbi:MAG: TetR/AcrR family transcriptional regulator [Spirochaetales bacterium]|nr:TetR/AcrR family transcriptional regulator [Spirochaetales bacterium]